MKIGCGVVVHRATRSAVGDADERDEGDGAAVAEESGDGPIVDSSAGDGSPDPAACTDGVTAVDEGGAASPHAGRVAAITSSPSRANALPWVIVPRFRVADRAGRLRCVDARPIWV